MMLRGWNQTLRVIIFYFNFTCRVKKINKNIINSDGIIYSFTVQVSQQTYMLKYSGGPKNKQKQTKQFKGAELVSVRRRDCGLNVYNAEYSYWMNVTRGRVPEKHPSAR